MSVAIYRYEFMMNGTVGLISLAENEEEAERRVRALFGKKDTYVLTGSSFSHNTGEFSINTAKVIKQSATEKIETLPKAKGDLMTNVMDAYAKDKKITL